jgi:hypothetical protein
MKTQLLITLLFVLCGLSINAQEQKIKLDETKKIGTAKKTGILPVECLGGTEILSADLKWRPILTTKCISHEPETPNEESIKEIKEQKTILKRQESNKTAEPEISTLSVTPVVGANWLGNVFSGNTPLDNNIAISNGGIIVSVANNTLEIDNTSGALLYYNDLATFYNDPTITNVCDPVTLYDALADRFILFFQECSGNSANSYLCICFSKTNNPNTGGWWKYKITGNPLNNGLWFDYPKMAISNNELYITGNLFDNTPTFQESVLYQIDKVAGYSGGTLNAQVWSDIDGAPFTLLPVGNGHGLSYSPGCLLVSTNHAGGSTINLYDLTDYMTGNPALNYYSIATTAYSPSGYVDMVNTIDELDPGDCRAFSGFYLNGIIHFVFHSDAGGGWWGMNYNRLDLNTLINTSSVFGFSGTKDYCYPSVSAYSTSVTDKSVMIGFLASSNDIYPEVRVVNCDNSMSWSPSTLVRAGDSYVNITTWPEKERWGDYTGTSRKHNSPSPSIWMNGMYGNSSDQWDTWIAEIHDNLTTEIQENQNANHLKLYPNPVVETFTIEFPLTENTIIEIDIFDNAGKEVKKLYKGKALQGENVFSFNKANLSSGVYYLSVKNNFNTIKNEKIIIQ